MDDVRVRLSEIKQRHPPVFINLGGNGSPAANGTLGFRFMAVPEQQRWFIQYLAIDATPVERPNVTARVYIEDDRQNSAGRITGTLHGNRTFFGPLILEPGAVLGVYYGGGMAVTDKLSWWIWGYAYDADDPRPFSSAIANPGGGAAAGGKTPPIEYGCLLELDATINIPNATLVTIGLGGSNGVWDSRHEQPSGVTWFNSATGIVTVPADFFAGLSVVCLVSASFHWTNNFVGQRRQLNVLQNGGLISRSDHFPMPSDMFTAPAHELQLAPGDQIQWQVYQDGGGTNPLLGGVGVGTACAISVIGTF